MVPSSSATLSASTRRRTCSPLIVSGDMKRIAFGLVVLLAGATLVGCGPEPVAQDEFAIEVSPSFPSFDNVLDDANATMPHLAVSVLSNEVTDTVDDYVAGLLGMEKQEYRALDGHELVLATLHVLPPPYGESGSAIATVLVDGDEHEVTEDFGDAAAGSGNDVGLLMSVPIDAPVQLQVVDEDRTVTVDLRTGETSGDGVAGSEVYRASNAITELSGKAEVEASADHPDPFLSALYGGPESFPVSFSLDGATARLHPWIDGIGWAPDGTAYLVIRPITTLVGAGLCMPGFALANAVTLTPDGGQPIAPTVTDASGEMLDWDSALLFAVPADIVTGTITFAPEVHVADDCVVTSPAPSTPLPFTLE